MWISTGSGWGRSNPVFFIKLLQMETFYTAGYYLIKLRSQTLAWLKGQKVSTCSGCINLLAFDFWCFGWGSEPNAETIKELELSEDRIKSISSWTNDHVRRKEIIWGNVFPTLELATEFQSEFYPGRQDIGIYCLEFSETDRRSLNTDFAPGNQSAYNYNNGKICLRDYLLAGNKEIENDQFEFLGFDLIGVEGDGGFHSFHCHGIYHILGSQFGLKMNDHGLFDQIPDPESLRNYLNEPDTPVEDVPWYIVKVKRMSNESP